MAPQPADQAPAAQRTVPVPTGPPTPTTLPIAAAITSQPIQHIAPINQPTALGQAPIILGQAPITLGQGQLTRQQPPPQTPTTVGQPTLLHPQILEQLPNLQLLPHPITQDQVTQLQPLNQHPFLPLIAAATQTILEDQLAIMVVKLTTTEIIIVTIMVQLSFLTVQASSKTFQTTAAPTLPPLAN